MPASAVLHTGRLVMRPVGGADLAELQALKADPRAFAMMLGGVRSPRQTAEELAGEISLWARRRVGIWTVRDMRTERFIGIAGLMERADGRGIALRFALMPDERGHGYASEAAGAALRYAHREAGLDRVVAVTREDNLASRQVLGAIGMRPVEHFMRDGHPMLTYESRLRSSASSPHGSP